LEGETRELPDRPRGGHRPRSADGEETDDWGARRGNCLIVLVVVVVLVLLMAKKPTVGGARRRSCLIVLVVIVVLVLLIAKKSRAKDYDNEDGRDEHDLG